MPANIASARGRVGELTATVRERLGLSRGGFRLLIVALVAMVVGTAALVAVAQDVRGGDGLTIDDPARLRFFSGQGSATLLRLCLWLSDIGAINVLIPLAVLAGVVLWYLRASVVLALVPLVSLGIAAALAQLGRASIARAQPHGIPVRLQPYTSTSFPSGHAADSAALCISFALVLGVVALRRPITRVLAVLVGAAICVAVGVSRLVLGVHWPTDVIAGWALGTTTALLVTTVAVVIDRLDRDAPAAGGRRHAVGQLLRRRRNALA
jgi:undecaprenyl-diphosphatase